MARSRAVVVAILAAASLGGWWLGRHGPGAASEAAVVTKIAEQRVYVGARQTRFVIHPSSGLAKKPPAWVMAFELVETTQLFARTVARLDPEWLDRVGQCLGIHAAPGIDHGYSYIEARMQTWVCAGANRNLLSKDGEAASLWHSVTRVDAEIKDSQFELIRIDEGRRNSRLASKMKLDRGADRAGY